MKFFLPLAPALISFGPVMMVQGSHSPSMAWAGYLGALMTAGGGIILFCLMALQARELKSLRERLEGH